MKVNTTDYTVNPRWVMDYYEKIAQTMGERAVDEFLRFYVAIGLFHNRNVGRNPMTNALVPGYVDFIAMLDDWVEHGQGAGRHAGAERHGHACRRSRSTPLSRCARYPMYPRYKGWAIRRPPAATSARGERFPDRSFACFQGRLKGQAAGLTSPPTASRHETVAVSAREVFEPTCRRRGERGIVVSIVAQRRSPMRFKTWPVAALGLGSLLLLIVLTMLASARKAQDIYRARSSQQAPPGRRRQAPSLADQT